MCKKLCLLFSLFFLIENAFSQTTPHHDFPTAQPTSLKAGINTNAMPLKWFHIHEPNINGPGDCSIMLSTGSDGVFANYGHIAFTSDLSLQNYTLIKTQVPADYGNLVIQASEKAEDIILTTRNQVGHIRFATTETSQGTDIERVTIRPDGKVGIGVTNPQSELAVNGNICAHEITVSLSGAPCWADTVFSDDYDLLPLEELEILIEENGHLPEVPTSEEVEQTGINLGEMQVTLLKKIEELTLYVIELNNENIELKKKLEQVIISIGE